MAIKLLSKQEISQKQALQKRAEIEEGKKLAKRVDNLREVAVQEEASLASFRVNTLKVIDEEFKKATKERDEVLLEIKTLRNELEAGFSELKNAEITLFYKEEDLVSRETQIEEKLTSLKDKEEQLKKEVDAISIRTTQLESIKVTLKDEIEKAEIKMQTANSIYAEAESFKTQTEKILRGISEELHNKDINIASRERDITIKEERIVQQGLALRERELQLRDREQTLEREFKRLKQ